MVCVSQRLTDVFLVEGGDSSLPSVWSVNTLEPL
jgi:hypothetical protein